MKYVTCGLTSVCIGYGDLPDAEMRRNRSEDLSEGQGDHSLEVVASGQVWRRLHVQEGQGRTEEAGGRDDVHHRESRGVREDAQDLFAQNIVGGTERVPAHAQEDYLHRLVNKRFRRHVYLST